MPRNTGKPSKPNPSPRRAQSPAIKKEVKYLGMAAGGVLLLVGVFIPGAVGTVGDVIRSFLLGLLGAGAFVLPVGLIALAVLGLISRKIQLPLIQGSLLLWFVLAFLHMVNRAISTPPEYLRGFEYIRYVFEQSAVVGGGIFGAVLGEVLRSFLGAVGTIIILVVGIIILLVLLTGRSFVNFLERGVDKAKDIYDERATRRYEDEQENEQNIVPLRRGKKAGLKPLPSRRRKLTEGDVNAKPEFINVDDFEESEIEDSPRILLVQEELEDQKKTSNKGPLFARRGLTREKRAEIVSFPEKTAVLEAVEEARIIPGDDDNNDDALNNSPAPIINGLVEPEVIPPPPDRPIIEDELKPLFDYDENSGVDFDEYAHASAYSETNPDLIINSADSPRAEAMVTYVDDDFEEDEEDDDIDDDIVIPINAQSGTPNPAPRFAPMPAYEGYQLPSVELLAKNDKQQSSSETRTQVHKNSLTLEETLRNFKIEAKVVEVSIGPTVTRYDLAPGPGVKVSSIANLSNDLALSLAAQGIRIEAPIPGKAAVGIEIPNKDPQGVFLRDILEDERFETFKSKLAFAVGKDIAGSAVVTDVADMPHLLIAGSTGSGKSVCINTLVASLLYKARPDEVKLLMIDPKIVELSVYNGIPHLLIPVVTDPKKASGALNWAVQEMENRYAAFAETGCRNLKGYNRYALENELQKLPQIVIIIDELADLMMTCKGEVEEAICRLAQKARAAGIYLVVATQRPSVDVITGLIKANIPSRLAFAVSSGTDSRTVLDMYGAEKLLGKGDMLFLPRGQNKPIRVQGGFISDKEVELLVEFLKAQAPVEHTVEMIQQITMPGKAKVEGEVDEFFHDAVEFLLVKGKASTSMLQRQFRIGYNRASRLMEDLEIRGIVGPEDGVKPRKVTITREEYKEIYGNN